MATCIRLPVYFLLIAWAKCFPHNLSIARQWVAIVAVKMNYNYFRLQFSPILELVMNARPLQRKSVKWCQKTAKWGLGETGRWIVCVCLPVPSESARLSFGRERTYFFTVYNYVGILTFTRSIPKLKLLCAVPLLIFDNFFKLKIRLPESWQILSKGLLK